jgi:hypothetical protein
MRAVRKALLLAAPAVVLIVLVPAGSAKPTPVTKFEICVQNAATSLPGCSSTGAVSTFDGNQDATVQLSVINDKSSTGSIGSADITVPPQLKVVPGSAAPSKYVTTDGQHIKIQGVNLPGGKGFVATFHVDVACGGQFAWPSFDSGGAQLQFAYASSDGTGSSFDYLPNSSTGVSTNINTACHLAFLTQPTDTPNNTKLWVGGSSTGGPVEVGLFSGASGTSTPMATCPLGYEAGCSVGLGSVDPQKDVNVGLTNNGTTQDLTQPLQLDAGGHLVATFSDVEISAPTLPAQFDLTATGTGSYAPQVLSSSFLVASTVNPIHCGNGNCAANQQPLNGVGAPSFVDVTGVTNFTFMTLSPFTLGSTPDGCTGDKSTTAVTGFAESDGRQGTVDTLTINYYVSYDALKARYGANVGQQFIPICVGARPVDSNGIAHDCSESGWSNIGWLGDPIDPKTGKFTGKPPVAAVCNADGYYWGIIGSFQDKIPAGNPLVTGWGGATIAGTNYRVFTMSVPPGWDYRTGP